MTGETETLVLELLRGMRAEMSAFRTGVERRFSAIEARLDAIETQLEGWCSLFVATTGALATGLKDHDARIAALEGTPA